MSRAELLLAIDTSGHEAGVVLAGPGRTEVAPLPAGPSGSARTEDLAAAATSLLAARGATPRDLTLLGAVTGPGSYTGLRSGLAFLRGLAFADASPAVGIGALDLLAWRGADDGEAVMPAIAAGSGRFAASISRRRGDDVEEVSAPRLLASADLARAASEAGVAAVVFAPHVSREAAAFEELAEELRRTGVTVREPARGSLESLALLVAARAGEGRRSCAAELLPLYVGEAHARPNRHRVAVLETPE